MNTALRNYPQRGGKDKKTQENPSTYSKCAFLYQTEISISLKRLWFLFYYPLWSSVVIQVWLLHNESFADDLMSQSTLFRDGIFRSD